MQIMLREEAEKRNLFTKCPITGARIPFTTWRIELSEEERQEHQKLLDEKALPF